MARLMALGSLRDHLSTSSSILVALAGLNVHRHPVESQKQTKQNKTRKRQTNVSHTASFGANKGCGNKEKNPSTEYETVLNSNTTSHWKPMNNARNKCRQILDGNRTGNRLVWNAGRAGLE